MVCIRRVNEVEGEGRVWRHLLEGNWGERERERGQCCVSIHSKMSVYIQKSYSYEGCCTCVT